MAAQGFPVAHFLQRATPRRIPTASHLLGRVFQHRKGRWLEIRRVRFQAHRFRLVRRAERKQDEPANDRYLGNVGLLGLNPRPSVTSLERQGRYE
jgi:hypothetical protein